VTHDLCETKNGNFYFWVLQILFSILQKCMWFSVFCTRTDLHIVSFHFVLLGLCTNHFCVLNSDIIYCILNCHSSPNTPLVMLQVRYDLEHMMHVVIVLYQVAV
jgi:hypothetical protein